MTVFLYTPGGTLTTLRRTVGFRSSIRQDVVPVDGSMETVPGVLQARSQDWFEHAQVAPDRWRLRGPR